MTLIVQGLTLLLLAFAAGVVVGQATADAPAPPVEACVEPWTGLVVPAADYPDDPSRPVCVTPDCAPPAGL